MGKVKVLGVLVDKLNFSQALKKIEGFLANEKKHYVVTPNPEFIIKAQKDKSFKKILNEADLAVADGIGVILADKFLKANLPDIFLVKEIAIFLKGFKVGLDLILNPKNFASFTRVTGTDLVVELCRISANKGYRVFLLGGRKGAAKITSRNLKKMFPELKIDFFKGAADVERETREEWERTVSRINNFKPHFLFVAYGFPQQEKWIKKNLLSLDIKVAMGVGGTFDFISGIKKRAPAFFRQLGLEWLWRLAVEPSRFLRVLTAFPYFPLFLVWKKLKKET